MYLYEESGRSLRRMGVLIPDSAVAIDKKREAQPFRSEVDGFLPLSRHRSAVLRGDVEPHRQRRAKAQNDFETSQSDAFAAPGFHRASGNCGIRVNKTVRKTCRFKLSTLMREERQQATKRSLQSLDLRRACGAPTRILSGNSN